MGVAKKDSSLFSNYKRDKYIIFDDAASQGLSGTRPMPRSPFPDGWYFVEKLDKLRKRRLIEKVWMGQEIVAWCDDQGSYCVAKAFCPHMGSHLGPSTGGQIKDGCLVCPFHGFQYNIRGECVATPGAPPPTSARLILFGVVEIAGVLLAWWSSEGKPPSFQLPPVDQTGWSTPRTQGFLLRTHPEFTCENAVDINHLAHVHGYYDHGPLGNVSVDGAHLESVFEFKRKVSVLGIGGLKIDAKAVTHLYGLGYSFVEIHERGLDMFTRLWILVTPIDGVWMELVMVSQVQQSKEQKGPVFLRLGFLPSKLRASVLTRVSLKRQIHDVKQDLLIWSHKSQVDRPILNRLDGEIMTYRRYCRQFYPEVEETG